jgi:hypothetical protein
MIYLFLCSTGLVMAFIGSFLTMTVVSVQITLKAFQKNKNKNQITYM